jgi:hypothetical protein
MSLRSWCTSMLAGEVLLEAIDPAAGAGRRHLQEQAAAVRVEARLLQSLELRVVQFVQYARHGGYPSVYPSPRCRYPSFPADARQRPRKRYADDCWVSPPCVYVGRGYYGGLRLRQSSAANQRLRATTRRGSGSSRKERVRAAPALDAVLAGLGLGGTGRRRRQRNQPLL